MQCETGALRWGSGAQCWVGFCGETRVMLAGEVSSLLFLALEAAEADVCDSLGTLFS